VVELDYYESRKATLTKWKFKVGFHCHMVVKWTEKDTIGRVSYLNLYLCF